jgi:hypothetical protein
MDKLKKTNSIVMKAILQGWNFMRVLRLCLGISLIVYGIVVKEKMAVMLGVISGSVALANIGCCSTSGCAVSSRPTNKNQIVDYEELDNKI